MAKEFKRMWTIVLIPIMISCGQNERKVDSKQSIDNDQIMVGQEVFQKHCQSCHKMNLRDESMFAEVFNRLPEPSEFYFAKFIKDSKGLKASGDEYARHLDLTFTSDYEHTFSELTENQIQQLILFIKSKSR